MTGRFNDVMDRRWFLPALIAANGLALLCFRHFVSLDGPMHLLHAGVIKDALLGKGHTTQGMWVDASKLDLNLGDLLIVPMTAVCSPFTAHKLLGAFAITAVVVGAWSLARAYRRDPNGAWILVLPCAFGFVVVLGLFHFAIASGLVLALTGWWVRRPTVRRRDLVLLVLGAALCLFAHKAGGLLLLSFAGAHEAVLALSDRAAWRVRWARWPKWFVPALTGAILVVAVVVLAMRFSGSPVNKHEAHHPLEELLTLRTLLLFDSAAERPWRIGLGLAVIVLLFTTVIARRTLGRKPVPGDALLLIAVLLLLASFIRTPWTELLYITDRAQWLALLLFSCWSSIQPLPKRFARSVCIALIALHASRLLYIERRMSYFEGDDMDALLAQRFLEPGALVIPVLQNEGWLGRHRAAYPAMGYDGILFTGRDHLCFAWETPPEPQVRNYILSLEDDWGWIGAHIVRGTPPRLQQILLIGHPSDPKERRSRELRATLEQYYRPVACFAQAEVWTLRP